MAGQEQVLAPTGRETTNSLFSYLEGWRLTGVLGGVIVLGASSSRSGIEAMRIASGSCSASPPAFLWCCLASLLPQRLWPAACLTCGRGGSAGIDATWVFLSPSPMESI